MGKIVSISLIVVFLVFACNRKLPSDFSSGEFACDFCRMQIVDLRFKAEAVTKKGKVFRFDSIECLLDWQREHQSEMRNAWVTDFYHPAQWIELKQAYILKSKTLPSPMGGFLSAYATEQDFEKARKEFGGKP
ncbi:MAG: nitrous oxide reductase accessory protein NosL [Deltaproteobacteria bacterium]|nr:nitrous oxide reductase accessory protein NosL [Deltaproteobacteria bacterium]